VHIKNNKNGKTVYSKVRDSCPSCADSDLGIYLRIIYPKLELIPGLTCRHVTCHIQRPRRPRSRRHRYFLEFHGEGMATVMLKASLSKYPPPPSFTSSIGKYILVESNKRCRVPTFIGCIVKIFFRWVLLLHIYAA
jgi:hypothetical protein